MKSIFKRATVLLVAIVISVSFFYFDNEKADASSTGGYLVLVEQKDGTWKSYTKLIEKSNKGKLMIKTSAGAKALGLSYKNKGNGTFTIKKSTTKYNTYTKNSKSYIYTNGSQNTKKTASNIAYTNKTSKINVVSVGTLSSLLKYKYFGASDAKAYGYSGIICYSSNNIPISIPTATPKPTAKPTEKPSNGTTTTIDGVKITSPEKFLPSDTSGWGPAEDGLYALEEIVDGKATDTSDLYIAENYIEYSHLGAGTDGVYLYKTSSGYKLSISVDLQGDEIGKANASIVKAMAYTISSEASTLNNAIFESFTTDNTHGINEDSYVTLGDCKIKVDLSQDGVVTYIIKEA
jgi:hypothetical protein